MDLKQRARQLKQDIPAIFLCMKCPETPWTAKLCAGLAVAYALSPIDLIPDFIPVLGYLDDLLLLPALVALAVKLIRPEVLESCRERSRGMWENGKPKKWYYALPIALVWLLVLWLTVRAVLRARAG